MTVNFRDETTLVATKHISRCDENGRNDRRVVLLPNEAPALADSPMAFTASTARHCKLLIATTFTFAMLTTASQAYTPEQEQMCTGDAMRLCGSEIPDVERVTACMIRQRAQLSDARFWIMQAATRSTSGISALQSRIASPVHICSCSGV